LRFSSVRYSAKTACGFFIVYSVVLFDHQATDFLSDGFSHVKPWQDNDEVIFLPFIGGKLQCLLDIRFYYADSVSCSSCYSTVF